MILVTGGTGFIGSHTTVELLAKGFEVLIIDNLNNSHIEVVDAIKKISGKDLVFKQIDCCNKQAIDALFKEFKIKAVIHFAAHKAVGESVAKPLAYYHNNLVSLLNLLEACTTHKVEKFVFSSSCTVYGQPDVLPVKEDSPVVKPESPYGNTKKIAEEILADVAKANDINVVSLRYFNPVGAHSSGLIGELPLGAPLNLIPVVTQTAIGKRPTMQVFGDDYETTDGTCIRDYIHVVDIAKAHVIAIERLLNNNNKLKFEVFNLGTGNGNTVLEVIHAFEKVSGQKLDYKIAPRRSGDIVKVYADTTYANNELGWKAEKSLEEMLDSAWKWELAINKK
jgi:UDP-glucose 4-epimerase